MQTNITYNIPEEKEEEILFLLGYTSWDKAEFINEKIKQVVFPAISDVFVNARQSLMAKEMANIPSSVRQTVETMISITTV
jgi:putative AlgH/UPF0301 family transcriptional regulator